MLLNGQRFQKFNLSAFVCRLFHEDLSSIIGTRQLSILNHQHALMCVELICCCLTHFLQGYLKATLMTGPYSPPLWLPKRTACKAWLRIDNCVCSNDWVGAAASSLVARWAAESRVERSILLWGNVSSQLHLISPGCPRPNSALIVQKSGLKPVHPSIHPMIEERSSRVNADKLTSEIFVHI